MIRFMRAVDAHKRGLLNHHSAMRICGAALDQDAARRAWWAVKLMEGLEMSIDWQGGASDRGRNALPESYKPRALRLAAATPAEDVASQEPPEPSAVDLRKLEA